MSTTPGANPETALIEKYKDYSDDDARLIGLPSPGAMNYLALFSKQVAGTPFMPRGLGDKPSTILAVILTGKEMGMSPMQALRSYWLSPDGRLGMYADGMMAVMRKHGFKFEWLQYNREGCELKATRPDGETFTTKFTVEDAKTAGLYGKDKSPWPKYPDRMCKSRCIGDIFRTLGSDLGGGQVYSQEEIVDLEADERGDYGVPNPNGGGYSSAEHAKAARDSSPMGDYKVAVKEETTAGPTIVPDAVKETPAQGTAPAKGRENVVEMPASPKPAPPPPPPPNPAPPPVAPPAPPVPPAAAAEEKTEDPYHEVYCWTSRGWNLVLPEVLRGGGPSGRIPDAATATLRAQALTNEHRVPHQVVLCWKGARTEIAVCKVPSTPAPVAPNAPPPAPAAPAAPAAPSAAAPAELPIAPAEVGLRAQLKARIETCMDLLQVAPKTARVQTTQFFAGYFSCNAKDLPKTQDSPESYLNPVSALEMILNADINAFKAGPEQAGKRAAQNDRGLSDLLAKWNWTGSLETLARMVMYKTNNSPAGVQRFLELNAVPLMGPDDAAAWLAVRMVSVDAPILLTRAYQEDGISVSGAVEAVQEKLGKPLLDCAEADVNREVAAYLAAAPKPGDAAEPPLGGNPGAVTEAVTEEEPDGGDSGDFLFGGKE